MLFSIVLILPWAWFSMKKIILSIKKRPINIIFIVLTLVLYFINNLLFKKITTGALYLFMKGYFNDLICPFFFISYCNLLLLTVNKEMVKLHWLLLFSLCAGLVWEFVAPLIKENSVTDILDLVCYLVGTFFYWLLLKINRNHKSRGSEEWYV